MSSSSLNDLFKKTFANGIRGLIPSGVPFYGLDTPPKHELALATHGIGKFYEHGKSGRVLCFAERSARKRLRRMRREAEAQVSEEFKAAQKSNTKYKNIKYNPTYWKDYEKKRVFYERQSFLSRKRN